MNVHEKENMSIVKCVRFSDKVCVYEWDDKDCGDSRTCVYDQFRYERFKERVRNSENILKNVLLYRYNILRVAVECNIDIVNIV